MEGERGGEREGGKNKGWLLLDLMCACGAHVYSNKIGLDCVSQTIQISVKCSFVFKPSFKKPCHWING